MIHFLPILAFLALPLEAPRADVVADAVTAGVPQALASEIATRATERGVTPQEALAPVVAASKRGLPPDLIAAKVLEGLAKGMPSARVIGVANTLSDRLVEADMLLGRARALGLAAPADRRSALADMSHALSQGVPPAAVEQLVDAAKTANAGSDSVVAAAQTVGEFARRGVSPEDAMPLGKAVARRGGKPSELAAHFDAFRAEGGKDAKSFIEEAARRSESKRSLDGIVDHYGESGDRVVREGKEKKNDQAGDEMRGKSGKKGATAAEHPTKTGRGAVPGLDDAVKGKGRNKDRGGPKK